MPFGRGDHTDPHNAQDLSAIITSPLAAAAIQIDRHSATILSNIQNFDASVPQQPRNTAVLTNVAASVPIVSTRQAVPSTFQSTIATPSSRPVSRIIAQPILLRRMGNARFCNLSDGDDQNFPARTLAAVLAVDPRISHHTCAENFIDYRLVDALLSEGLNRTCITIPHFTMTQRLSFATLGIREPPHQYFGQAVKLSIFTLHTDGRQLRINFQTPLAIMDMSQYNDPVTITNDSQLPNAKLIRNIGGILLDSSYALVIQDPSLFRKLYPSHRPTSTSTYTDMGIHLTLQLGIPGAHFIIQEFASDTGIPYFQPVTFDQTDVTTLDDNDADRSLQIDSIYLPIRNQARLDILKQSTIYPGMPFDQAIQHALKYPAVSLVPAEDIETLLTTLQDDSTPPTPCHCARVEASLCCPATRCHNAVFNRVCSPSTCSWATTNAAKRCSNQTFFTLLEQEDICRAQYQAQAYLPAVANKLHPNVYLYDKMINGIPQHTVRVKGPRRHNSILCSYQGLLVLKNNVITFGGETSKYRMSLDHNYDIEGGFGGSFAQFINHSCQPNASTLLQYIDQIPYLAVVVGDSTGTPSNVEANDEITMNYLGIEAWIVVNYKRIPNPLYLTAVAASPWYFPLGKCDCRKNCVFDYIAENTSDTSSKASFESTDWPDYIRPPLSIAASNASDDRRQQQIHDDHIIAQQLHNDTLIAETERHAKQLQQLRAQQQLQLTAAQDKAAADMREFEAQARADILHFETLRDQRQRALSSLTLPLPEPVLPTPLPIAASSPLLHIAPTAAAITPAIIPIQIKIEPSTLQFQKSAKSISTAIPTQHVRTLATQIITAEIAARQFEYATVSKILYAAYYHTESNRLSLLEPADLQELAAMYSHVADLIGDDIGILERGNDPAAFHDFINTCSKRTDSFLESPDWPLDDQLISEELYRVYTWIQSRGKCLLSTVRMTRLKEQTVANSVKPAPIAISLPSSPLSLPLMDLREQSTDLRQSAHFTKLTPEAQQYVLKARATDFTSGFAVSTPTASHNQQRIIDTDMALAQTRQRAQLRQQSDSFPMRLASHAPEDQWPIIPATPPSLYRTGRAPEDAVPTFRAALVRNTYTFGLRELESALLTQKGHEHQISVLNALPLTKTRIIDNINDITRFAADHQLGYSIIISKLRNPGSSLHDTMDLVKTTVDLFREEEGGKYAGLFTMPPSLDNGYPDPERMKQKIYDYMLMYATEFFNSNRGEDILNHLRTSLFPSCDFSGALKAFLEARRTMVRVPEHNHADGWMTTFRAMLNNTITRFSADHNHYEKAHFLRIRWDQALLVSYRLHGLTTVTAALTTPEARYAAWLDAIQHLALEDGQDMPKRQTSQNPTRNSGRHTPPPAHSLVLPVQPTPRPASQPLHPLGSTSTRPITVNYAQGSVDVYTNGNATPSAGMPAPVEQRATRLTQQDIEGFDSLAIRSAHICVDKYSTAQLSELSNDEFFRTVDDHIFSSLNAVNFLPYVYTTEELAQETCALCGLDHNISTCVVRDKQVACNFSHWYMARLDNDMIEIFITSSSRAGLFHTFPSQSGSLTSREH
jgi:hypothetical protein